MLYFIFFIHKQTVRKFTVKNRESSRCPGFGRATRPFPCTLAPKATVQPLRAILSIASTHNQQNHWPSNAAPYKRFIDSAECGDAAHWRRGQPVGASCVGSCSARSKIILAQPLRLHDRHPVLAGLAARHLHLRVLALVLLARGHRLRWKRRRVNL